MLYVGHVEDDELYHNFIMVHNKLNGKIRLLQVDRCTVSPKLNKQNFSSSSVESNTGSSLSELNKQFGSKATKRLTEQRERLTMNIDMVKDQLEKTVSGEYFMMIKNWPLLKKPQRYCYFGIGIKCFIISMIIYYDNILATYINGFQQ